MGDTMKAAHRPDPTCEKCRQHFDLFQARLLLGGQNHGERWSGVVTRDGVAEPRWYDVSRAKNALAAAGARPEHAEPFSVPMLWYAQIRHSYIVESHLPHVDHDAPILLVTTHVDPTRGDCITLVDGIHRVARAYRAGEPTVRGFKFSLAFSDTLIVEPRVAILDELIAEAVASGAKIVTVDGVPCVSGGRLRDSTPDDHPLRAEMVAEFRRGPTVVNVNLPRG